MIVREVLTKFGFKVDDSGIKKYDAATAAAKKRTETFKKGVKQAGKVIAGLGVLAAGAATGLFKLVQSVADVGDQAAKDAKKLGLTAEAVQELRHASQLAGTDFGVMKVGLQALSRGLNDAATKGTGPAAEAFEQLGISLEDPAIKSRNLEQIMALVSDRFRLMPDDANKTALSMKLFSRSGAELIPLLNEGSQGIAAMRQEARDLGLVLSNEAARDAEQFNDDLTRLKAVLAGVRNEIGVELMPLMNLYLVQGKEWLLQNKQLIAQKLRQWIDKFVEGAKLAAKTVLSVLETLGRLLDMLPKGEAALNAMALAMIGMKAAGGGLTGVVVGLGLALGNLGAQLAISATGLDKQITRLNIMRSAVAKVRQEIADQRAEVRAATEKADTAIENARIGARAATVGGFGNEFVSGDGLTAEGKAINQAIGSQERKLIADAQARARKEARKQALGEDETARRVELARKAAIASSTDNLQKARQAATQAFRETGSLELAKKAAAAAAGGGGGSKPARRGGGGRKQRDEDAPDGSSFLDEFLGGGRGQGRGTPTLGTTINHVTYNASAQATFELKQKSGETVEVFTGRIWEKFKGLLKQRDKMIVSAMAGGTK